MNLFRGKCEGGNSQMCQKMCTKNVVATRVLIFFILWGGGENPGNKVLRVAWVFKKKVT